MTSVPKNRGEARVLCDSDPAQLADLLLTDQLDRATRSFAAEYLGNADLDAALICRALEHVVLSNDPPFVREGALYGLSNLAGEHDSKQALDILRYVSKSEPNGTLRDIAIYALWLEE